MRTNATWADEIPWQSRVAGSPRKAMRTAPPSAGAGAACTAPAITSGASHIDRRLSNVGLTPAATPPLACEARGCAARLSRLASLSRARLARLLMVMMFLGHKDG